LGLLPPTSFSIYDPLSCVNCRRIRFVFVFSIFFHVKLLGSHDYSCFHVCLNLSSAGQIDCGPFASERNFKKSTFASVSSVSILYSLWCPLLVQPFLRVQTLFFFHFLSLSFNPLFFIESIVTFGCLTQLEPLFFPFSTIFVLHAIIKTNTFVNPLQFQLSFQSSSFLVILLQKILFERKQKQFQVKL
jgi:hypothetical protein